MQSKIRSLASDTIVYGVSTVAGRFLNFLLTPLYSNYLTSSEIGDATAIFSMIAFVNVVYSLGMEPAFMRFWDRDNPVQSERVYALASVVVVAIGTVITIITILAAQPIAQIPMLALGFNGAALVAMAAFVPLLDALVLIPFARLRIERQARRFATYRLVAIVVTVVCNLILLVLLGMHIEGVFLASIIGNTVAAALMLPMVRGIGSTLRSAGGSLRTLLREMMRFGLPTVPSSFSSIMVQVADRPIMLMLVGSSAVGLYQTNFRLALPMMMVVTVFDYAFRPFYLNHRNDAVIRVLLSRVLTLFTAACGLIYLVAALFMPFIVQLPFVGGRFINPAYWSGLGIVPVVMLAYYFNGVFINLAAGYNIEKRTSFLPLATGASAAVSVVATLLLVPAFGIMGAAWAKVAAYAIGMIVLAAILPRVYAVRYDVLRVVGIISIAGAVHLGVELVPLSGASAIAIRVVALVVFCALLAAIGVVRGDFLKTLYSLVKR